jgi:hypothetical protein
VGDTYIEYYPIDEPIFGDQFPYYFWGFPVRNLDGYNGGLNLISNRSTVANPALVPTLLQKKPADAVPVQLLRTHMMKHQPTRDLLKLMMSLSLIVIR